MSASVGSRTRIVPSASLLGAAALVGVALLTALTGRPGGESVPPPAATIVAQRLLRFTDRADGAVIVTESDGTALDIVTGPNGFFRGTLAGMARTREMNGIGPAVPFTLTAYADNRLRLSDPTTGRAVELEAFGPTNEAVFARLLVLPPRPGARAP